jgi:hypothetical protein
MEPHESNAAGQVQGGPGTAVAEVIEIIDLEIFAREGRHVPHHMHYKIRVDKEYFVVTSPTITGREILEISHHTPPEHFRLDQQFKGGTTRKIELSETVDLTTPGIERFRTLPLDQTEGSRGAL